MPPNLGGFFMVRSYYPSECHADYFDFEHIEALKPAIESCGISTLSQSPMLGFHKQMDNGTKLLEEILSCRIQAVAERTESLEATAVLCPLDCPLRPVPHAQPAEAAEPDPACPTGTGSYPP